jgi:alpha-glucosidase
MKYCFIIIIILLRIDFANAAEKVDMQSPREQVNAILFSEKGQLKYSVAARQTKLIEPSILGLKLNGHEYGKAVSTIELLSKSALNQEYSLRGKSSKASNKCNVYNFEITEGTLKYQVEFKLFDDGCAFRYLFKTGKKSSVVRQELTTFTLSPETRIWYFERNSDWKLRSYAGLWQSTIIDSLPIVSSQGPIQGKPLIVELKSGGYVLLSEAALYDYSGMRFKALGKRQLQADFTEGKEGFVVSGNLITPWRVIGYAKDLNALVNTNIITNLNPAPDKKLFAKTEYIKPGRAVWSWISQHKEDSYLLPASEKKFIDGAHKLGFEYTLIDEGWEIKWSDKWNQLQELCKYGTNKKVGVWIWKHSKDLRNPVVRDAFLDSVKFAGAVGVKTDFMNSEAKELIDFEIGFLKACAARKLLVNFHGCQTSTGESRTYPNELTREGVRGMELNTMNEPIPAWHNAALPFTRFVTGHGDYTPGFFSNKGNTTNAHQLALFYLLESSLQCLAENPENLFDFKLAPARKMLEKLPVTWDETIVLPGSKIGVIAAMARRKKDVWYVAVINGTTENYEFVTELEFLKPNTNYLATSVTDETNGSLYEHTSVINKKDKSVFKLLPAGGVLIRIKPLGKPQRINRIKKIK